MLAPMPQTPAAATSAHLPPILAACSGPSRRLPPSFLAALVQPGPCEAILTAPALPALLIAGRLRGMVFLSHQGMSAKSAATRFTPTALRRRPHTSDDSRQYPTHSFFKRGSLLGHSAVRLLAGNRIRWRRSRPRRR